MIIEWQINIQRVMSGNLIRKTQSIKSENSVQKGQETIVIETSAKIHRAGILARIIHSLSLYKMQWALHRIKTLAAKRKIRHQKLGLAINRIFRRSSHQQKFAAFYKIKRVLLQAESHGIAQCEKIIQTMARGSKNIILIVLKSKRKQVISQAFESIKVYSKQTHFTKRTNQRKALRKILEFVYRDKKLCFEKLISSRLMHERKLKIKSLVYVLSTYKRHYLGWSFFKLRKNLMEKRRQQIDTDIKAFELKINNAMDPELQSIKDKKEKLSEHLNRVQQQKLALQQGLNVEFNQIQNRRKEIQLEVTSLEERKKLLQSQLSQAQTQLNAPYSMDEIYQCVYHNFLLYVNQNKEKVYNKQQILNSLTYPLIPINVPIDVIKQENKVMEQLLNQYIVMFGHKKLETPVQLPYQYLVKENQTMYKMLLTLLPQIETDRDDLRIIRDNLFKLNARVTEKWGK